MMGGGLLRALAICWRGLSFLVVCISLTRSACVVSVFCVQERTRGAMPAGEANLLFFRFLASCWVVGAVTVQVFAAGHSLRDCAVVFVEAGLREVPVRGEDCLGLLGLLGHELRLRCVRATSNGVAQSTLSRCSVLHLFVCFVF